jgi:hypothetical protein
MRLGTGPQCAGHPQGQKPMSNRDGPSLMRPSSPAVTAHSPSILCDSEADSPTLSSSNALGLLAAQALASAGAEACLGSCRIRAEMPVPPAAARSVCAGHGPVRHADDRSLRRRERRFDLPRHFCRRFQPGTGTAVCSVSRITPCPSDRRFGYPEPQRGVRGSQ